ncbi:MAG: hypothetical protein R3B47_00850 [Bacteroidia bacterium]
MVNRYEQDNEFTSRFLLTAQARRPKVFIVHGPRDERHESLVKRFTYEYIGGKGYLEPVDIGVWPVLDERQGRTNIRSDLARAFDALLTGMIVPSRFRRWILRTCRACADGRQ